MPIEPTTDQREEQPTVPALYVPAEQNLATMGYYDAGYKRRYPTPAEPMKSVAFSDGRALRTIPTLKYGYPNTEDWDFQRAFDAICLDLLERRDHVDGNGKKHRRPHLKLPICLSIGELVRRTGRADNAHAVSGRDRKAVRQWILRNSATGIEGQLRLANQKHASTFATHIFAQAILPGDKLPTGEPADTVMLWPTSWFLSNLAHRADYLLDHAFHQQLGRHAIAKNLYPVLSAGFLAAYPAPFKKSYRDTVALFGMPFHTKPSDRVRQLAPSVATLRARRFLDRATWDHRDDDSTVAYWPGPKAIADMAERRRRRDLADEIATPALLTPPDALADQQSAYVQVLADDIAEVCGQAEKNRRWYLKLAREAVRDGTEHSVLRKALSDTKDAKLTGRVTTTPSQYLNHALADLRRQVELPLTAPAGARTARPTPAPYEPPALTSPPPTLPLDPGPQTAPPLGRSLATSLPDTEQTAPPGAPREGAPSGSSEPA